MSEFVASNGMRVWIDKYGNTCTSSGHAPEHTEALREFFQHEADERLGRWRWPDRQTVLVYESDSPDRVFVIDESDPKSGGRWYRRGEASLSLLGRGAMAYFAAHPVQARPEWHDAKPGEVWVLTYLNSDVPALCQNTDDMLNFEWWIGRALAFADKGITAGRRIWPEDANA